MTNLDRLRLALEPLLRPLERDTFLIFENPLRAGIIVSIRGRAHFVSDITLLATDADSGWDRLAAHCLSSLRRPHPIMGRPTYTFAEMLMFAPVIAKALKAKKSALKEPV